MIKELSLSLPPEIAFDEIAFEKHVLQAVGRNLTSEEVYIKKLRRSVDARSKFVKINVSVRVYINEKPENQLTYKIPTSNVSSKPQVIIVGSGPAGLFAALHLIEVGIKPIILERGKNVRDRRRDLAAINKDHIVDPDSNYCFGEGGAGTYSDGKLYTRSDKRGNIKRILEILVAHGANEDILVDAHPHIGTNKLPKLIEEIRNTILNAGGEIHFNSRVSDFIIKENNIQGVITSDNKSFEGIGVILATGHSARDIFHLLYKKSILIESKSFAIGVRVEHHQNLIDKIQYHCEDRGNYLPAASYSLVTQVPYKGIEKGVFSFCMCPGGFIVPSATANGEVVVNGMSPSKRDSKYSNSGIVVAVDESDWDKYKDQGPMAGLLFQAEIERKACELAGKTQNAPAQRLVDFVNKKVSDTLPQTSYQPGLTSVSIDDILPSQISERLKVAFKVFGDKMKGYFTNEAVIVGVESRTSSPVKIPRDKDTFEHPYMKRLFPCGEGAGYAGGIVSAAMDGENAASKLVDLYKI